MMKRVLLILLCLLPAIFSQAATQTAVTAARTDVLNAYNLCNNGDTLVIPAGSVVWSSKIAITKQITIQGAGVGSTIISNSQSASQGLEEPLFDVAVSSGQVVIHDIRFTSATYDVNDGVRSNSLGAKLIIYNCQFDRFSFALKILSGFGLCYNTTFLNNDIHSRQTGSNNISAFAGFVDGPPPWGWNSQNYFVFEDCTFTRQNWVEDTYSIDTEYPANYMVRHCTFNEGTAANVGLDGVEMHGVAAGASTNVPLGIVVYSNNWIYSGTSSVNSSKLADVRGGAYSLIFSNDIVGPTTYGGYIYARSDPNATVKMTNSYFYSNTSEQGAVLVSGLNGNALGVNYFTTAPSPLNLLPYPHPLRTATPKIVVTPSSLNFGGIATGTTKDLTFTVQNTGAGTLSGAASVPASSYSIVGTASYSLGAGATATITVRFAPATAGTFNRTVTFTGGAGTTASVTGTGQPIWQVGQVINSTTGGAITSPYVINADGTISQTVETLDPTQGGEAKYFIQVPTAGNYTVNADVLAPNGFSDSLFINFDTTPTSPDMIWDVAMNTGLTKTLATWRLGGGATKVWSLSAGTHTLILRGREATLKIANINVSPPPETVGVAFNSIQGANLSPYTINGDNTISQNLRFKLTITYTREFEYGTTVRVTAPNENFLRWIGDVEILNNFLESNTSATIPSMDVRIEAIYNVPP
jgi:hypothetical protein